MPYASVTPFTRSRRLTPRLEAPTPLLGRIRELGLEGRIRDVSFGGFTIDVTADVAVGQEHSVEFVCDESLQLTLRGRAVYCRATNGTGGQTPFLAAFAFTERGERPRELVSALVQRVLRGSSREWVDAIASRA